MVGRVVLLAALVAAAAAASGGENCAAPRRRPRLPVDRAARRLCTPHRGALLFAGGAPEQSLLHRHVRGVVFGGMDGILTTFALLAAAAGSHETTMALTLVIGISTVLADALSMGAGEYLSAKAEAEISTPDASEAGPVEKGVAMFIAFTCFGAIPLLSYLIAALWVRGLGAAASFQITVAVTGFTLFVLGTVKSTFGDGIWWQSGAEVTAIGGAAASVAYYSAQGVDWLVQRSGV